MEAAVTKRYGFLKYAPKDAKSENLRALFLILGGFAVGIVNGFFGAGGGMLVVPLLAYVAVMPEKKAHATAIAVILPLSAVSAVIYSASGTYDTSIFLPTIIGVVAGGVIGAIFLKKSNSVALTFFFYSIMMYAGLKMLLGS